MYVSGGAAADVILSTSEKGWKSCFSCSNLSGLPTLVWSWATHQTYKLCFPGLLIYRFWKDWIRSKWSKLLACLRLKPSLWWKKSTKVLSVCLPPPLPPSFPRLQGICAHRGVTEGSVSAGYWWKILSQIQQAPCSWAFMTLLQYMAFHHTFLVWLLP